MLFELKQSLNLKLQQQLLMTPQLQQAIRLLQLSRLELVDAINAELEQNPALEEEVKEDVAALEQERAIQGEEPKVKEAGSEADRAKEVTADKETANEIDWQQWLEQYNSAPPSGPVNRQSTEDLPNLEQTLTRSDTLQEHLERQLGLLQMVEADRAIALEVIGALDENG